MTPENQTDGYETFLSGHYPCDVPSDAATVLEETQRENFERERGKEGGKNKV